MRCRNFYHSSARGQSSLETLFVVGFAIIISLGVALPYVSNQTQTNVSMQTKLAILPWIERNMQSVRIAYLLPKFSNDILTMNVSTLGEWDSSIQSNPDILCSSVFPQMDPSGYYSIIHLQWYHNPVQWPPLPSDPVFCSQSG